VSGRGDSDDVVETHDGFCRDDEEHGLPKKRVSRCADLIANRSVRARLTETAQQPHGNPREKNRGGQSEAGQRRQHRARQARQSASQRDCADKAKEEDALAKLRRQGPTGERDEYGVVAAE
jgi:hypothetical protein